MSDSWDPLTLLRSTKCLETIHFSDSAIQCTHNLFPWLMLDLLHTYCLPYSLLHGTVFSKMLVSIQNWAVPASVTMYGLYSAILTLTHYSKTPVFSITSPIQGFSQQLFMFLTMAHFGLSYRHTSFALCDPYMVGKPVPPGKHIYLIRPDS